MLPNDIARCMGVGEDGERTWREGCEDCKRRTEAGAGGERTPYMTPPAIIAFECEYRIEP